MHAGPKGGAGPPRAAARPSCMRSALNDDHDHEQCRARGHGTGLVALAPRGFFAGAADRQRRAGLCHRGC